MSASLSAATASLVSRPTIVYDGECPFCSRYVRFLKLRENVGSVDLLDARSGGALVGRLLREGFDLDEGMVLLLDGKAYHGADCINRLALLSSDVNAFNRFNRWLFQQPTLSRVLYPILRAGRNFILSLLGRGKIASLPRPLRYRRYVTWTVILSIMVPCYVAVAHPSRIPVLRDIPGAQSGEIYPFFNWSLFTAPRRHGFRYSVEVLAAEPETEGAKLVGKVLAVGDFPFMEDIRFHKSGGVFARVTKKGNAEEAEKALRQIENYLVPYGITSYRVVKVLFDPFHPEVVVANEVLSQDVVIGAAVGQ